MKLEPWIKAIPESQAHGSGTCQKRLWRLTSDYVRIRDWHKYGYCVATGRRIPHWKEGDAGHFKSYSKCNGMFKFDERNIHLQAKSSNGFGDYDDWKRFEFELARRGIEADKIERENAKLHGTNVRDHMVIEKMKDLLVKMKELPEQPEYYKRVLSLYKP